MHTVRSLSSILIYRRSRMIICQIGLLSGIFLSSWKLSTVRLYMFVTNDYFSDRAVIVLCLS